MASTEKTAAQTLIDQATETLAEIGTLDEKIQEELRHVLDKVSLSQLTQIHQLLNPSGISSVKSSLESSGYYTTVSNNNNYQLKQHRRLRHRLKYDLCTGKYVVVAVRPLNSSERAESE